MDIEALNKAMTGGGAGVVVCVIDRSVAPVGWLDGRVYAVDFNNKGDADGHPHGTAVASVIIDHCPNAYIYSYNVKDGGYVLENINKALADIIARAKTDKWRCVVNMSLAGDGDTSHGEIKKMDELITELVGMGVPVVVAAGNDYGEALGSKYPSCFQSPICVAAIDEDGKHAGFSTWHNEVDFADLGIGVRTLNLDGTVGKGTGTSFAAPIVAAKCAALLSRYPKMTEPELFEVLKANAQDLETPGFDPYTGWGWIASLDVSKAAEPPETPIEPDEPKEGTMLTAAQLISYFQRAVSEGWGYVWSLNGVLYTRELAEYYHKIQRDTNSNRDPATYWLTDCAKWIGKMAADCSGGIVGAIRTVDPSYIDRTANLFYAQCPEKGPASTIPEIPGLCVWREGHIGIYEGNGNVLEFRGTEYGAVRTKLNERNFTHWGKLRDIKYNTEENEMAKVITKNLTYDADVEKLQTVLNGLGYPCGTADGKAGDKTLAGIAAFVAAHGGAKEVVEVPAELPNALTLAVEVGGKKYSLDIQAK